MATGMTARPLVEPAKSEQKAAASVEPASDDAARARISGLALDFKHDALFPEPGDSRAASRALIADLAELNVRAPDGQVVNFYEKLMADAELAAAQKKRILRALSLVRESLLRQDNAIPNGGPNKGYQVVNWKHTRAELDQVLDAAKLAKLKPAAIEDALLASMFSDAVKWPTNFVVHNIDGAAAAVGVLSRLFDPKTTKNVARLAGISMIIKEHQIGPPQFMANYIKGQLTRKLKEQGRDEAAALAAIAKKISRPFSPENLLPDGSAIAFTEHEKGLLRVVGLEDWFVPHEESTWYGASRAVIDGDSLINYASPDGWAKIAAIRGPETLPFFEDPTVFESLQSAKHSYDDALTVISPAAKPLAEAGLQRTKGAVRRMRDAMRVWFASQNPFVPANPDGSIAFWNASLKYPSQGALSRREQEQFNFAKIIRERVVAILRAEQNVYEKK